MALDDNDLDEFGLAGDVQTPAPSPSATPPVPPLHLPKNPPTHTKQSWQDLGDALRKRAVPNRPAQSVPLARTKQTMLPFGEKTIATGCVETFQVRPQMMFRPTKLLISESTPGTTEVQSVFVGNQNQLPQVPGIGGIASQFFSASTLGGGIKFAVCHPAISITITIKNNSNAPVKVAVVLAGSTIE